MADYRTHTSIAERNHLAWHRRAVPLRRWYGRLSLAAILIGGLMLLGWTLASDERVFWAAPVSSAHNMLQHDCRACHEQMGTPLLRIVTWDSQLPSVRDEACQKCHRQTSHDHHSPAMIQANVRGCVDCHREHSHRQKLAAVGDARCTECHADLQTTDGNSDFTREVRSFGEHSEFRIWRGETTEGKLPSKDRRHALRDIAGFDNGWQDRTALKFNHRLHLVDQGVLMSAGSTDQVRKKLVCGDCHRPDASGQYMKPISYKDHCASCHRLEYSGKLAAGGALPHVAASIVEGVLRERLLAYAREHADNAPPPRLPNKSSQKPKDEWEFVERELRSTAGGALRNVKNGCAHCHVLEETGAATGLAFRVVEPKIPGRWLPHSRFDHERHSELSCAICHNPDFEQRHERGHGSIDTGFSQLQSEKTGDILMPKIGVCRSCHGSAGGSSIARAKADCVVCHDYHTDAVPTLGKMDAWLREQQGNKRD